MDIKKEKQQDEEEDELEDVEIQELLEKKKKLEHDLEIIYDKKEVKHEVFDVESSASEKEDKFKDEKLYNLDKILSKKIKNSSGKEIVIIKKHYDDKVGLNVFYCQICEKSVDGETNLKTHIFGVRHLRNEVVWPTLDKTKSQSSRRSEGMNFLILFTFSAIFWVKKLFSNRKNAGIFLFQFQMNLTITNFYMHNNDKF